MFVRLWSEKAKIPSIITFRY